MAAIESPFTWLKENALAYAKTSARLNEDTPVAGVIKNALAALDPFQSVTIFGCGDSYLLRQYAKEITAIDISVEAINRFNRPVSFQVVAPWTRLRRGEAHSKNVQDAWIAAEYGEHRTAEELFADLLSRADLTDVRKVAEEKVEDVVKLIRIIDRDEARSTPSEEGELLDQRIAQVKGELAALLGTHNTDEYAEQEDETTIKQQLLKSQLETLEHHAQRLKSETEEEKQTRRANNLRLERERKDRMKEKDKWTRVLASLQRRLERIRNETPMERARREEREQLREQERELHETLEQELGQLPEAKRMEEKQEARQTEEFVHKMKTIATAPGRTALFHPSQVSIAWQAVNLATVHEDALVSLLRNMVNCCTDTVYLIHYDIPLLKDEYDESSLSPVKVGWSGGAGAAIGKFDVHEVPQLDGAAATCINGLKGEFLPLLVDKMAALGCSYVSTQSLFSPTVQGSVRNWAALLCLSTFKNQRS